MEYLNIIQVRNIIGDYANIYLDEKLNAKYKCCDICKKECDDYKHIGSDPLYILDDKPGGHPMVIKRDPCSCQWILVKGDIREKYFPRDMIWIRKEDTINLRNKFFPDMNRIEFYEYICNEEFFECDFSKDFKIITHCINCKEAAFNEVEPIKIIEKKE